MNQISLDINNKDAQEKLLIIFEEINEGLLRDDEDIQQELDPIYDSLNEKDKSILCNYLQNNFPKCSFWQAEKYYYEKENEVQIIQQNQDFKKLFEIQIQQKKNWQDFINLIKIQEFCNENQIPDILVNKESLSLMQKLKGKLFYVFEFLQILQKEQQQSNLIIKFLLQFLYDFDELDDKDQNFFEQIIGSLLNKKIFEFFEYQDSLFFEDVNQFQLVTSLIQDYQLKNKDLKDILKDERITDQQKSFIELLCTQDLIIPKQNINEYILRHFLKITEEQKNILIENKLWNQKLLNKMNQISLTNIEQYELVYFRILIHFWIQYFNQINQTKQIKELYEDLKKAKPDRKVAVINRYLPKIQKQLSDPLHQFVCNYLLFFNPDQSKLLRNEQFIQFKLNNESDLKQYKRHLKTLTLNQLQHIYQYNKKPQVFYLLYFFEDEFVSKVLDLFKLNHELKTFESKLQQFEKYSQKSFLQFHEIILLLDLFVNKHELKMLYYIEGNLEFHKQFLEIQKCATEGQIYKDNTIEILNIDPKQWISTKIILGSQNLHIIAENCINTLKQTQTKKIDQLYHIIINIAFQIKYIKSKDLKFIQTLFNYFRKMNLKTQSLKNKKQFLLKYIMSINSVNQNVTMKQYQITLFLIFNILCLFDRSVKQNQVNQSEKRKESQENQLKIKLLEQFEKIIPNKAYDFDLMKKELQNNTQIKLILEMLLIQYMYKNENTYKLEDIMLHCKILYDKDCVLYERLYQNFKEEKLKLSSQYFSSYQQFQKLPKNANIQLYDFNISLSEMTIDEQNNVLSNWVSQLDDHLLFKKLVPIYFDIIKRGEDSKNFVSLINKQIEIHKLVLFKKGINMKALFQILYNNSNYELQVMLLKFYCKYHPIPFLYKNDNINNDEVYILNEKLFYIIPDCLPIINFSLSSNLMQVPFGKTDLINQTFYQMNKFEISDQCEINNSTIDIMFDFSFNGSRQFAVADTHGVIPQTILEKVLRFFKIWIIQLNTENELINTFQSLKAIKSKINNSQEQPVICLIIRNSLLSIDQLKQNQEYNEIFQQIKHIHCIQDLTKQNMGKHQKDYEFEQFQHFIFEILSQTKYRVRSCNQKIFLEGIKRFNNINLSKQIEDDGLFIHSLEQELEELMQKQNGFYNQSAFPIRSLEFQISKLYDEKNNLLQLNQNSDKVPQIEEQITQLESSIKDQQFTKILTLFCEIFNRNNSYILYLSFVEKLRIFNEINSIQIQNKIESLNQELQQIKKERKSMCKNEEQEAQQENLRKILKDKINQKNQQLQDEMKKMLERSIGIELFWREVISLKNKSISLSNLINPVDIVYDLIKKGEPFEFLDGDQLKIDQEFLKQLTDKFSSSGQEKVLVLSILGPQSSGKSMILNKIFGCHFWTSVGRCTKGIYLQLLKIQSKKQFDNLFDYLLILDTEGLQNPNQIDTEFDKKIALFVLSISDIIIINVKSDIHSQFKNLVEMCIFTLGQMKSVISANKQLSWCFNCNSDVNVAPFLDQIQKIASNLNLELTQTEQERESQNIDYSEILDIKKENIQVLGFAFEQCWTNSQLEIQQNWRQLKINDTFSKEAYQYGLKIIKNFVDKRKQLGNDECPISSLHFFIQNIETNWQSICMLPDLLEFTELIQYKQDQSMKMSLDEFYKNQNFDLINNLEKDIQNYLNEVKHKNFQTFQELQEFKENQVIKEFQQIKTQIQEQLQKIKQEKKISKKIYVKYLNRLTEKIQSQIEECKVTIYSEVKLHETKFQETYGFRQIEKFISDLCENQSSLENLQKNPNLIEQEFKKKWEVIIQTQQNQSTKVLQEYSEKQYISISCSFAQYSLKTTREQHIKNEFIKKINQSSPFLNQYEEKKFFLEIFNEELKVQQFITLDSTRSITVYGDIFIQPIADKLRKAKETDLININNYYNCKLEYYYINKQDLENYLTFSILEDFKQVLNSNNKKTQSHISQICQFLLIVDQFKLNHDRNEFDQLMKAINDQPNFFERWKSYYEKILKLFENLQKSFLLSNKKIVLNNLEFFQSFKSNFKSLKYQSNSLFLINTEQCELHFQDEKAYDQQIIIYHSNKIIPIDENNQSLQYIAYQNNQSNKSIFTNNFIHYFSQQMMKMGGWQKLYFELYDIIFKEMKSNYSIIKKDSQTDSDEELGSVNINLIQIIMQKIKIQIQLYNKQFAIFGITLSNIGERCIYYYSMLLIWRFSCYQKWKTLKECYNNLQKQYSNQFEKFKADIQQNKANQSKIKAQSFSEEIYKAYVNKFYLDHSTQVQNYVKTQRKDCHELIKICDQKLLENYNENLSENQKNEILDYITNQKNYIEVQAMTYIVEIKIKIENQLQKNLREGLDNYLSKLQSNIAIIYNNISNQQIDGDKVNEYFEFVGNDASQDLEFEKKMFKLIKHCIFGVREINPILKEIRPKYQDIFMHEQFEEIPQIVINVEPSLEEIQQLRPYIQTLLKELKNNLTKCKTEILKFDNFQIQNQFDEMKKKLIGCLECCPFCNRKCDEQIDNDHKHKCKNGHQLRGMNYVLVRDKPSLLMCEEIKDEQLINTQDSTIKRAWKDFKKLYKDWDFNYNTFLEQHNKHKNKMINVWNKGIGHLVCNLLTEKYRKKIEFISKSEFDQQYPHVHYILLLDDSGSMKGEKFNKAKQGCIQIMSDIEKNPLAKISLIIFNNDARVEIDCEEVNIKQQSKRFTFKNGGTDFENAFQTLYILINKHISKQFDKHIVLFYTDGGATYPKTAMKNFFGLPQELKYAVSLFACSEESNPVTLSQIVQNLQSNRIEAQLFKDIQVDKIQQVWVEVVQKGVHFKE